MKTQTNNSQKVVIFSSVIFLLIITTVIIITLTKEDAPAKAPAASSYPTASAATEHTVYTMTGILETIDTDRASITLLHLDTGESMVLSYNGATDIRSKYDKVISATQLHPGDFLDACYDTDSRLVSLHGNSEVWSYKNVGNLVVDDTLKKMTISKTIYRYDDKLRVLNNESFISLNELSSVDLLNIYGLDNYIYLIKVASGHGYLTLSNESDFIGGTLYLGVEPYAQVTDDLQLTLAEGEYDVTVTNLDYTGNAIIKISRDRTSTFNLAGFGKQPQSYGRVSFTIEPEGAELYIDSVKTFYNEDVSLTYGTHTVEVVLGGYVPYDGELTIAATDQKQHIILSPNPVEEEISIMDELEAALSPTPNSDSITDSANELGIPDSTSDDTPDYTDIPTSPEEPENDNSQDGQTALDDSQEEPDDGTSQDGQTAPDDSQEGPDDGTSQDGQTAPDDSHEGPDDDTSQDGQTDGSYNIIVKCTEGTSVYMNDEYMGIIKDGELAFSKQSGTMSIRLELDGHSTKYYTVTVENDAADTVFSFPDMVKAN